jgi:hypothetical protein
VNTEKSGHALIVYKKEGNFLFVADPNHPQDANAKIEFDLSSGTFKPYLINGEDYDEIDFLGKPQQQNSAVQGYGKFRESKSEKKEETGTAGCPSHH